MDNNKKLELTLCGCLPYGLKIYDVVAQNVFDAKEFITSHNQVFEFGFSNNLNQLINDQKLKPLLHSLEKLTEPILDGGLIPIVELAKMSCPYNTLDITDIEYDFEPFSFNEQEHYWVNLLYKGSVEHSITYYPQQRHFECNISENRKFLESIIIGDKGIRDLHLQRAEGEGEDLVVTKDKIRKDAVQAINNSVFNLSMSGKNDLAEQQLNSFNQFLEPKEREAILNSIDRAIRKKAQDDEILFKENQNKTESTFGSSIVKNSNSITLEHINNAEVLKQITPAYANILREYKTGTKAKVSPEEKSRLISELSTSLFSIDNDEDNTIDKSVTFEQISNYRMKAFEAFRSGAITEGQLSSAINFTESAFQGGLSESVSQEFNNAKNVFSYLRDFANGLVRGHSFGQFGLPKTKVNEKIMADLSTELMRRMSAGELKKPEDVPIVARQIAKHYLDKNYPGMVTRSDIPNAVVSGGGIAEASQGKSNVEVDSKITIDEDILKNRVVGEIIEIKGKKARVSAVDEQGNVTDVDEL